DETGALVAQARVAHRVLSPAPDLLEHDALRAWCRSPRIALAEVGATAPQVAGVCVASMVPSLAVVDSRGIPRSPGLLYGDGRGRVAGRQAGSGGAAGMPDAEGFVGWAAHEAPGAAGYWPAQAVANYALGRVPAIDTAMAMSMGGLHQGGAWDTAALARLGVDQSQMPVVVQMGAAAGEVLGTGAALAGGTVDAMCDQIVSGATEVGDVLVICGATLVVWAVVPDWIEVPGLWTVPHTVPGRVLVGGPSNAGALFVDWAASLLGDSASARPASATEAGRDVSPEGVPVWLPYVRGERVPFHDPALRASVHDLDITHRRPALLRGAYEASGFVVRHMLERAGLIASRIVASGGGTRRPGWMEAIADATGLPVDVVGVPEGAALGAAYMARMAAGLEDSLDGAGRWASVSRRVEPDARWRVSVDHRYGRFLELGPTG
ncbi:MAG TPA: FGGY-family carbohydrate kinase, partial [Acidimicrobiales bacterium]|nr:FGGY-family carbohydrate kinase [Acidimicrobiales bacterium]